LTCINSCRGLLLERETLAEADLAALAAKLAAGAEEPELPKAA
jgi:hypothetical protein